MQTLEILLLIAGSAVSLAGISAAIRARKCLQASQHPSNRS